MSQKKPETEHFEAYNRYSYEFTPVNGTPPQNEAGNGKKPRKKGSFFFRFLIGLCILSLAIIVLQETVFRLQTVYVIGCEQKTPEQVVTVSGLQQGQNMIGISEEQVASAIGRDHTLIFKGMQKEYPSKIYLYIAERRVVASTQILGVSYLLDGEGMVMSADHQNLRPEGYPVVHGFPDKNVTVGKVVPVRSPEQLIAYREIMKELELQLYADQIRTIDLNDPMNLFLVNLENITIQLGDSQYMRAKIGSARSVMGYMRQLSPNGGIMDVTIPEKPKYGP